MSTKPGILELASAWATRWSGSSLAFALALSTILIWAVLGPVFHYSDTWQLVINTGTTIVTFLMVFLIQRSQNKESIALHLKLNELLASLQGPSNRLINIEDLTEAEINKLHQHFSRLVEMAQHDTRMTEARSIEDAPEDSA